MLVGLLLPAVQIAREAARRMQCILVAEIMDGLSNTIVIVEDAGRPEVWINGRSTLNPDTGSLAYNTQLTADGWGWADIQDSFSLDFSSPTTGLGNKTKKTAPFAVTNNGSCTMNCTNDSEIYSFHPGGAHSLRADGSVHFMNSQMDGLLLVAFATKSGHEVLNKK